MAGAPLGREPGRFLKRARLLEEMGRPGHDRQLFLALKLGERLPVEFEHVAVFAADDEKRGGGDGRELTAGEIRPAAARHDRRHPRLPGGRHERRRRARARAT